MRGWRIGVLIIFGILIILLSEFFRTPKKIVRLAGSTAFLPFAEKLAETYMSNYKDVTVEVQGGGSATGIMAALQGIVDIGMVDLLTLPKEVDGLRSVVVARDGIAVVVHPSNAVRDIAMDQLGEIFSGRIANWNMLGGADAPIRVVSREEGSGTRKSFDTLVLKDKKLTGSALFQDSNGTIRETVARDPGAIGYISIGFLVPQVKALEIDGVVPSNAHVVDGTYKISRPIFLIFQPNPSVQTQEFIDYLLGAEGQEIIKNNGLIPVRV